MSNSPLPSRDVSRDSWLPPVTRPTAAPSPSTRTRLRDLHAFRVIDVFRGRSLLRRLASLRWFRRQGPDV